MLSSAPRRSGAEQRAVILRSPVLPVTRVVVGVDGSAGSLAALYWAAAEAVRSQAGLRIISVWQGATRPGPLMAGHPAQAAARRVQKALALILSQQHYPRRIACAALPGTPGKALLSEARDTGLLVLGATATGAAGEPGATGRYCLQHGRGPLVLVPTCD